MRPVHLPEVLGQGTALRLLQRALSQDRVTTAYCFVGPEGVGKGLTARWFAQAILCEAISTADPIPCSYCLNCRLVRQGGHPDLLWVEPTFLHQGKRISVGEAKELQVQRRGLPQIRLDQVQEIVTFASRAPLRSSRSIVIMDGAQALTEASANALLKTLEEPGHALVILIAPSVSNLLPTLVSRCQTIPFRRLSTQDLLDILAIHDRSEISPTLLTLAQGSPGTALDTIDQWQQMPQDLIERLQTWPQSLTEALSLGRTIAKSLDVPGQIWLVNYLQHHLWHQAGLETIGQIKALELIRRQLLSYVQPQLVWEINLSRSFL